MCLFLVMWYVITQQMRITVHFMCIPLILFWNSGQPKLVGRCHGHYGPVPPTANQSGKDHMTPLHCVNCLDLLTRKKIVAYHVTCNQHHMLSSTLVWLSSCKCQLTVAFHLLLYSAWVHSAHDSSHTQVNVSPSKCMAIFQCYTKELYWTKNATLAPIYQEWKVNDDFFYASHLSQMLYANMLKSGLEGTSPLPR